MTKKTPTPPAAAPSSSIDIGDVQLTKEPFAPRRNVNSKYADIFARVSKNERIKCPSGKAGGIGHTLRRWLNQHVCDDAIVTTRERCDDGHGGVWWLGERDVNKQERKPKARKSADKRQCVGCAGKVALPCATTTHRSETPLLAR